jgi:predicted nucleic acid-binding protein
VPGYYVLDSEALSALASPRERGTAFARAKAVLVAAKEGNAQIRIPAPVIAEVHRGGRRDAAVNRVLGKHNGVVPMDAAIARTAGALLGRDGLDSCHAVDAFVIATAIELGVAVVCTGDPDDLDSLAREHENVVVLGLR